MNKLFRFKEFSIDQSQTAMKIGTDAVLLGAWTSIEHNPESILDIGAGTGILSLMLAQRSSAQLIDAVEIDDMAYLQCVENFENSSWSDRVFCYHASLDEFSVEMDIQYDLIISNPPFFDAPLVDDTLFNKTEDLRRRTARFSDSLPLSQLANAASKLLSEKGIFSLIVPFDKEAEIIEDCSSNKLYPKRILRVRGHEQAKIKRSLIEFSRLRQAYYIDGLSIEKERHFYTDAYINLTKEFYINM